MTTTPKNHQQIMRRLHPLYAAAFLQGFVLWYAVEKLFMVSIGFTAATIGLMAAAYSVIMLLIDTPAGLLADRWSRKGMLIIGSVTLALSSLICGLSTNIPVFIIGAALWGIFFGFYSGMYDSIVYDVLAEDAGHSDHYERYYGRIRILDSAALIAGSLIGGFMGSQLNLRVAFFATIPIALASIIPLVLFKEPQLHKHHASATFGEHLRATLSAVAQRGGLTQILAVLILGSFITNTIFEFYQLWLIGTHAPVWVYGPANALLLATIGLAGFVAPHLKLDRTKFLLPLIAILVLTAFAPIIVKNTMILILAFFLTSLACLALDIVYLRKLHDRLPSRVRSGASSASNTLARIAFIGGSLLVGWLTQRYNVFAAGWPILIPVLALSALVVAPMPKPDSDKHPNPAIN